MALHFRKATARAAQYFWRLNQIKTTVRPYLCLFFLLSGITSLAQSQEKVFATLIMKFSRSAQWPDEKSKKTFVVGVLSYSPLSEELMKTSMNMKKGSLSIKILDIHDIAEAAACDVLFVPSFKTKSIPNILKAIGNKSCVVVSNKPSSTQMGSAVNFLFADGKFAFEFSARALSEKGIKISTELKGMGTMVP